MERSMTAAEDISRGRKREGRRRAEQGPVTIHQAPFAQPRLTLEPVKYLSDDHIEAIHQASLKLLEDVGMEVILNTEALEIFARAGARVEGERVRIGREVVEEALRRAPPEFVLNARNPAHSVRFGGNWIVFGPVGGPPNCSDMDRGRRPGTFEDSCNFIRLSQFFNIIHMSGGGSTDALDIHASVRHLHVGRAKAKLSDKVYFVSSTGRERLFDGMEIARIACGVPKDKLDETPVVMTVINTNSPLKLDGPMAMGIIELARHGQVCCVTPFTLAGAMAPVTMAGALVEQNAEALAGLVLSQFTRAGAKFIYGGFTSNVDMKSGAPAFGTPEYMKAAIVGGQLARRYKLPYRTSSTNAANTVDA
jgi:trimethylamine--corrinoid protein Co-methyltransferase